MAVTTVPSAFRYGMNDLHSFYGFPVPPNIQAADMWDDLLNNRKIIRWRVKGDPTVHEIDFPHVTEENILAVLAAMRLSC